MKLTFGAAIEALKIGATVRRAGWNGKNMFLYLNMGSHHAKPPEAERGPLIDGIDPSLFELGAVGTGTRLPHINMRSASGSTVTGWLASQSDMLASDWEIVDGDEALPADVRRLVIASREVAFGDFAAEEDWEPARKELDEASEAFADRVPWEDEPEEGSEQGLFDEKPAS